MEDGGWRMEDGGGDSEKAKSQCLRKVKNPNLEGAVLPFSDFVFH
jgi:hypothetical protein